MQYTQKQLKKYLNEAWSYESREGWGAEELPTEFIGTVQKGKRLYDIYVDTSGNYWYMVRIIKKEGIVSEFESIFGYPETMHQSRYYERALSEERTGGN